MMRSSIRLAAVLTFSSLLAAGWAHRDTPPPQNQLKTYPLHNKPNSADISPDEILVATECTLEKDTADPKTKTLVEEVQLWNFKEDRLVAEFPLQQEDSRVFGKGHVINSVRGAKSIRFSPDGRFVVASISQTIYVLRANDLSEIRTIPLLPPTSETRTIRGKETVFEPELRDMEISPNGNVVAVLWVTNLLYGTIDLYDLSSGNRIQSWRTPQGWVASTHELTWSADGIILLVAIPNLPPCMSPGSLPDVFAFDVRAGAITQRFRTGLLAGSLAVAPDGRALVVDMNCLGVFANHHPKLKVFDLSTGKHLRDVSGRGFGVRYLVSASADGTRFLAFTGKMKAGYDWGDFVPYDKVVDETFSVWDLKNYEGIVTSQNIPGLRGSGLRISPKGGYAVSYGRASFVYELP